MAWQRATDLQVPFRDMGGTVLQASTTITSSTASTGVELGKGLMAIEIKVTAVHQESGFDAVIFYAEANTKADTSTYEQFSEKAIGDATGIGIAFGTGTYVIYGNNDNDNDVRINCKMQGSTDSITYSAKAYPLRGRDSA